MGRAGPETMEFGGDTSCVDLVNDDGAVLVLDAGSGLSRLNQVLDPCPSRVDVLLTHLHLDHLQGLGFFRPAFRDERGVSLRRIVSPGVGCAAIEHVAGLLVRGLATDPVAVLPLPHDVGAAVRDRDNLAKQIDAVPVRYRTR